MKRSKNQIALLVSVILALGGSILLANITAISSPTNETTYNRNASITTSGTFDQAEGAITVEILDDDGNVMNSGTASKSGGTWSATIDPPSGGCWEADQTKAKIRVSQTNNQTRDINTNNEPDPCPPD